MRVGSNPTPVRKRFERDETEPSADKFCHTGMLFENDSPEQKKTKKSQRRMWLITEWFKSTKKIPRRDMWNTNVRVGLNANLYKRMTQTVQQTKSLICKFYPIEKAHIIQKKCRRKPGRMAERSKAPDSRNSSVENSGTRVCAWFRIPLLSENVLNTMRQSQLTNSIILEHQVKMTV